MKKSGKEDTARKKSIAMAFTDDIFFFPSEEEALLYKAFMEKKHHSKNLPVVVMRNRYFRQLQKLKQKLEAGNWKLIPSRFAGFWYEKYLEVKRAEGYFPNQYIRETSEWITKIVPPDSSISESDREALTREKIVGAVPNRRAYAYYHDYLHFPAYHPARLGLMTYDHSVETVTKIKDKDGKIVREDVRSQNNYTLHEIGIYPHEMMFQHGRAEASWENKDFVPFRTFTGQYLFRWSKETRKHASKFLQLDHDNPYLKK